MSRGEFAPLRFAGPSKQTFYKSLAEKAKTQYRAAVKLHCIECMGWSHAEVKQCTATHCPLWSVRKRVFK